MSKLDEIRLTLTSTLRPVIIGISVTWLDTTVTDAEEIPSYATYHRNRGGGVIVYVTETSAVAGEERTCKKILWIEVGMNKRSLFLRNLTHQMLPHLYWTALRQCWRDQFQNERKLY